VRLNTPAVHLLYVNPYSLPYTNPYTVRTTIRTLAVHRPTAVHLPYTVLHPWYTDRLHSLRTLFGTTDGRTHSVQFD